MKIDWFIVSVIGNILLMLYGVILTTYTIIKSNKEKRRQISVKVSNGWLVYGPELSKFMLIITIANPGNRTVAINTPHIKLPDRRVMFFPRPSSNVTFPHELEEGKDCTVWNEMEMLKHSLIKHGYSGKVKLEANVSDRTGKVYKAKKPWILDLK